MAPNSPSCSFIHAAMAGSHSTAPLNRSKSVLIVARLSASNRARVFKPVATPGAGTWEATFPEDRASLLDSILHVSGVLERRQVGVEAVCVAILAGYKSAKRDGHPDDCFCQSFLRVRFCRSVLSGLSPRPGADESFLAVGELEELDGNLPSVPDSVPDSPRFDQVQSNRSVLAPQLTRPNGQGYCRDTRRQIEACLRTHPRRNIVLELCPMGAIYQEGKNA